jgi:hypothetical protein
MKNSEEFPTYPPLFFIRITEKLRNLFLYLYRKFTHPNVAVFEMVHHFWLAAALGVAAELGIADILKKGAKTIRELALLTHTHEESLYRLMRMLASHDIFKEINEKYFTLTPLAKSLQEDQVKYLITGHLTKLHFQMFGELMFTIRTGKKSSELFMESTLFEHIGEDEQRNEQFNKAMTSSTMMQVAAILPAFSFRRFRNIVDIGGGQGLMLAAIIRKYPGCIGIVFDLPQSTSQTIQIFEKYEITNRAEIIAGSFFEKIPEGGDLYMLKSILHNWDDESCRKILSNIYKAMTSTSRLLILESVIDEGNEPSFGKMTDMLMMVAVGGKERTKAEYESLLTRTGFRIRKIHPTISPLSLIEAEKA